VLYLLVIVFKMKKILIIFLLSCFFYSSEEFDNSKTEFFKSYDYEQVSKYKEATKVLMPLYKKNPINYTLNLRLGWLLSLQKHYKDAIKYYEKASLIRPRAIEPKLGLTRVYLNSYSFAKAQSVAVEILKVDYYNYYANLYMIRSLIAQQKYKIATEIIDKMRAIYPTDVLFLEELLVVYGYTKHKDYQSVYEKILLLDPNNVYVRSLKK